MIREVKKALRISEANTYYDTELLDLVRAGIADVEVTGAKFYTEETENDINIPDPLARRAVITYVRCNFGSPDDYDRVKKSYDEQKAQLRCNSRYTVGGDSCGSC